VTSTTDQVNIRLSKSLRKRLKELQRDPLTGKTRYGSMTMLMEALLWEWVKRQTPDQPKESEHE
jgi:hypothetical protein